MGGGLERGRITKRKEKIGLTVSLDECVVKGGGELLIGIGKSRISDGKSDSVLPPWTG